MIIVYSGEDDRVAYIHPSPKWADKMVELGEKMVPKGKKFKIVEESFLPTDRTFRDAWEIDESELTDGVGAKE